MNRKESDLVAKALHAAKPPKKKDLEAFDVWFTCVRAVKDALMEKGHIQGEKGEERFLSIADEGIVRGSV